jgi:hypothetical protein
MAIVTSGVISIGTTAGTDRSVIGEFGGSAPHSLSEYYGLASLPGSGEISLSDFYGQSAGPPPPSYGSTSTSVQTIPEDNATSSLFQQTGANIIAGTTLDVTLSGTAALADIQVSTTGATSGFSDPSSATITLTVNGNNYNLWIRAKADLTTEGGDETVIVTVAGTDSAGTSTGSGSETITIQDTSLDPPAIPAGSTFLRIPANGLAAYRDDIQLESEPEVNAYATLQMNVFRELGGFFAVTIRNPDPFGNWESYTVGGATTARNSSSVATAYQGPAVNPSAMSFDGVNWTSTPNVSDGIVDSIAAQAVSDSFGIADSQTTTRTKDIWIRAPGYADTLVASFQYRVYAYAVRV